jgi:histidine triad (HIT) family protein
MDDCIFGKIVSGSSPSSKVYEDDSVLAFLDIQPVRRGQTLIIPKQRIDHFSDIPDDLAQRVFLVGHRLSRVIRKMLEPERVGLGKLHRGSPAAGAS